jgi:iron complex transport system ATP-binding protein
MLLDGQPLESWSSKAFARKVAYLPQQLPQAEGMTVRELVAIGRYPWHGALGALAWPTERKWKRRLRWSG